MIGTIWYGQSIGYGVRLTQLVILALSFSFVTGACPLRVGYIRKKRYIPCEMLEVRITYIKSPADGSQYFYKNRVSLWWEFWGLWSLGIQSIGHGEIISKIRNMRQFQKLLTRFFKQTAVRGGKKGRENLSSEMGMREITKSKAWTLFRSQFEKNSNDKENKSNNFNSGYLIFRNLLNFRCVHGISFGL